MLGDGRVVATIAVKDITVGKQFYGGTLGLSKADENEGGVTYECGSGSLVFIYTSSTAGSGQATCAYWDCDDPEAIAAGLKEKGVVFEHYDMPGQWEGDFLVMAGEKAAWFKDPDGNTLSLGRKA